MPDTVGHESELFPNVKEGPKPDPGKGQVPPFSPHVGNSELDAGLGLQKSDPS